MKVLTLQLGDKTYTTSRITAHMAKEAMRINKDSLTFAKNTKADSGSNVDVSKAEELMENMLELADRKSNLICEVYGNKFTVDELDDALTSEEISIEILHILRGVNGIVEKN